MCDTCLRVFTGACTCVYRGMHVGSPALSLAILFPDEPVARKSQNPLVYPLSAGVQGTCHYACLFTWVLGLWTRVLMLTQQMLLLLGRLPQCSAVFID